MLAADYGTTFPNPAPVNADGELDNRRYRLNGIAARLDAVLCDAQSHIDRRYGAAPTAAAGSLSAVPPSRTGSVGKMDDAIDRLEDAINRAGSVIATLGAL